MKKTLLYILGFLPLVALAQVDRSKAPAPGPAPAIKIGQPATFTLANGLRVFVVTNNKIPQVSATLTLDMDGIVEGEKTGVSSMAGELLRRGTSTMNKAQLDEAIDFLGASVSTGGMSASASSLKQHFPRVFSLLSDMILRPSFSATELEKIRTQSLSALQQRKDNPGSIATNVANRLAYGKDHPYGDIETEATLKAVTMADVKQYVSRYWKPNNAYLVFVGAITAAEAKALTEKSLGAWKKGEVKAEQWAMPKAPAKTFIALVDRPASVQSQIQFISPVDLKPGAPDAIPVSVMSNILGGGFSGRLFATLREKYGFTYGAYSDVSSNRLVGSFKASASVRNEKTDSAIGAFLSEFNRMRNEAIGDTEVIRMKNYLSGSFARSLENPSTIAQFALSIARNKLPANYYQNYLKNLAAVDPRSVAQMANRYVQPNNLIIVIVGNAKQVAPGLEKYGEVRYFDFYGNPTAAPQAPKKVAEGVSAQSILQKAADAVASAQTMGTIKDVQMKGTASIQGMQLELSEKTIVGKAYVQEATVRGMVLQKQMVKGGQYTSMQQGQNKEVDAGDKDELNQSTAFFEEAWMLKQPGYQFTLGDIEKVNGQDAYAVHITSPGGNKFTNFYDATSGLRVKTAKEEEGPAGKVTVSTTFSGFKNFNGVMLPTKLLIDQGMFQLDVSMDDIKVNSGLTEADIK